MNDVISTEKIDYNKILFSIKDHFIEVMSSDEWYDYFKGYRVQISRERQFIQQFQENQKTIYIVVKFGGATNYFGQTILPCTISALSEHNNITICQDLMSAVAIKFNLGKFVDGIQEIYQTPEDALSFNEVYSGFRDVFNMNVTFVITNGIAFQSLTYYYGDGESETVPCVSQSMSYSASLDSKAFYSTKNFTTSVAKLGTLTCACSMYLFSTSKLLQDCLKIISMASDDSTDIENSVDNNFLLGIKFGDNADSPEIKCNFKLLTFSVEETIGEIPVLAVGFSK